MELKKKLYTNWYQSKKYIAYCMHDTFSLLQDLIQNHKSHRELINQVTRAQSSRIKLNPTS